MDQTVDHTGRKILIGILLTVAVGVCFYFISYNVAATPRDATREGEGAGTVSAAVRPVRDGAISPEASAVSRAMVGVWRSGDEQKFTREFRDDGTVVDRYEGDKTATKSGIWGAFTADMAPEGTTGLVEGVVYIQMTFAGESMYFAVTKAADTLELVYLNSASGPNFTRMQ
ncbi:MAG: hypothetical protein AAB804_00150 [Patescibacteria group bacterium]